MQHEEPVLLPHTLDSVAQTRRPRSVAFTQPPPGIRPGWPQRPERDPRPWLSPGQPQAAPPPGARRPALGAVPGVPRALGSSPGSGLCPPRRARARAPLGVGGRGPRRGRPHLPTRPRSLTASHLRPRAGAGASGQGQPPPPGRPLLPLVLPHRPGALLLSPGLQGLSLPRPLVGQAREPPPQRGPGQGHAPGSSPSCGSPWGGGVGAFQVSPQDEGGRAYRAPGGPCRAPPSPRSPAAA